VKVDWVSELTRRNAMVIGEPFLVSNPGSDQTRIRELDGGGVVSLTWRCPPASGRGESHPPALSEPCLTVSRHTAPIIRSRGWSRMDDAPVGEQGRAV
jgi:hypothetical protein